MKVLIRLIASLLIAAPAAAIPPLTENTAARIIDDALKRQPLFWQGFAIPYVIELKSTHKDADMLKAMFKHGLLTQKKEMRMIKLEGADRKKITMIYEYDFADPGQQGQGFYYGIGRLKDILSLSPAYQVGDYFYAEAYVRWYVDDFQSWAAEPAFRKARTLRRSKESKRKPFEKRLYLQHDGNDWAFWQGKPGAL